MVVFHNADYAPNSCLPVYITTVFLLQEFLPSTTYNLHVLKQHTGSWQVYRFTTEYVGTTGWSGSACIHTATLNQCRK